MAQTIEKPPLYPRKKHMKKNKHTYKICDEYQIKSILTEKLLGNELCAEIIVQFVLEEKISIKTEDIFQIRRYQFELSLPGIEIYVHTQKIPTLRHLPTTYNNFKIYLLDKQDVQEFFMIDIEHYEKLCLIGYADFLSLEMVSHLNNANNLHYLHIEIYGSYPITYLDFNLQNLQLPKLKSFKCIVENTEISIFDIEIFCKNLKNIWIDCLNWIGYSENILEFLQTLARPKLKHLILQTLWDETIVIEISNNLKQMHLNGDHSLNWIILKDDSDKGNYILHQPNFKPETIDTKEIQYYWNFVI